MRMQRLSIDQIIAVTLKRPDLKRVVILEGSLLMELTKSSL
jgi:hypothetical protein